VNCWCPILPAFFAWIFDSFFAAQVMASGVGMSVSPNFDQDLSVRVSLIGDFSLKQAF
jgi:hypothetical protein